ncbi:MAG TPA: chromate transporter [Bacillota bacterium]|jgi:chromate transporter|nr:chromate transporter [Bacillota bacterium]HOB42870.1 chromate transporter [Bacillota bacterium]HOK69973.1 chromate transporter [Bacillota bacterium]HPQ01847.1 chromate transporter [Bacillota bacterium]HPZ13786.1 chromate transporter [Bacillota bacterium]
MNLLHIYLSFAKVGLFTFGGGYAMLPLIESDIIQKRGWLTMAEFTDMVAIAEVTPGPIAVNSATFVGYKLAGIIGGIVATLGVITPSIVIVLALAALVRKYERTATLSRIKVGMRPAVAGLIAAAAISVAKVSMAEPRSYAVAAAAAVMVFVGKIDPILVLAVCGILGALIFS